MSFFIIIYYALTFTSMLTNKVLVQLHYLVGF